MPVHTPNETVLNILEAAYDPQDVACTRAVL